MFFIGGVWCMPHHDSYLDEEQWISKISWTFKLVCLTKCSCFPFWQKKNGLADLKA
jgi:hypothetical protein